MRLTAEDYALDQIDFDTAGHIVRLHLSSPREHLLITFEPWPEPTLDLRPGQPYVMLDPQQQPRVRIEVTR